MQCACHMATLPTPGPGCTSHTMLTLSVPATQALAAAVKRFLLRQCEQVKRVRADVILTKKGDQLVRTELSPREQRPHTINDRKRGATPLLAPPTLWCSGKMPL
ncbi:hypothetical protein BaRGS_00033581 [Batillaria attramentaria]